MNPSNRRRYRRWVLWSVLSVCLLMLAAWGVSTKWSLEWTLKNSHGGGGLDLEHGVVHLIWDRKTHFFNYDQEFNATPVPFALFAPWGKNYTFAWQSFSDEFTGRLEFRFPLGYLIFIGIAFALYYRWSAGREFPPGHCGHCGHDLRGTEHERCPHCGTACEDGETTQPSLRHIAHAAEYQSGAGAQVHVIQVLRHATGMETYAYQR